MMNIRRFGNAYPGVLGLMLAITLLLGPPDLLEAQVATPGLSVRARANPEIHTYNLKITPSKESVPTFKHRLSTLPHETIVGNAATHYLRSFGENSFESPLKWAEEKFGYEEFHNVWLSDDTPISALPLEKVREATAMFDGYVKNHIDRASKCRTCDWGLGEEDLKGDQVFSFLLPSVQQMRSVSRVLALRTRLAVADKRFDDAVELMRMNYKLGQDVGEINMLVCDLVGMAHITIANGGMRDFISTPGSPNMYWALSELPRPLVDLRDSLRLESQVGIRILTQLSGVETATHSKEEWARLAQEAANAFNRVRDQVYSNYSPKSDDPLTPKLLTTTAFGLMAYGPAKKRLVEDGYSEDAVEAMAVGQVLLIDAAREYQKHVGHIEKSLYVSFPNAMKQHRLALSRFDQQTFNSPGQILAGMLAPASMQLIRMQHRVQRDVDALRLVEAIRMHAAVTGNLPKDLAEIQVVPVPDNPMTDKPFEYRLEGGKAIIELPKSDGVHPSQRFVIQM